MRTVLTIFIFTILVTAFYSYVGQMVPQKITYPPEATEMRADMTPTELAQIGEEVVADKGTCLVCHTIGGETGGRFPDLANIGAVAGQRREGYSALEYLAESLYEPNIYIVEGFAPGMPEVHKPPISLSDDEILAVIAYLQSLGSTPTVTLETKLKYHDERPATASAPAQAATPASTQPVKTESADLNGKALMEKYLCIQCHKIESTERLVGPGLGNIGKRLSKAELYEALLDPDATVAEGYPKGMMSATLDAMKFSETITPKELKTMVDYLASLKGN